MARNRLRELPTPALLEVHDLIERILNSDEVEARDLRRLEELIDRSA